MHKTKKCAQHEIFGRLEVIARVNSDPREATGILPF
jgi:hypothetical protein